MPNIHESLYQAARTNNTLAVTQYLQQGANPNWQPYTRSDEEEPKFTALHWAAYHGNSEMAEKLLKKGANSTIQADSSTPMWIATKNGHWQVVREIAQLHPIRYSSQEHIYAIALNQAAYAEATDAVITLLQAGANPNNHDAFLLGEKNSPLHWAAIGGNTSMLKALIQHGADLNTTNSGGKTAIETAADNRQWAAVIEIATLHPASQKDKFSYCYALMLAAKAQQLDAVTALLQAGAPSTWHINPDQNSALHYAALQGNIPILQAFIRYGADLNAPNGRDKTPIEIAVQANQGAAVTTLLDAGATPYPLTDPDFRPIHDRYLLNSLHHAIIHDNPTMLKPLIRAWANASSLNYGSIHHEYARYHNKPKAIQLFAQLEQNSKALVTAAKNNDINRVKELLEQGAKINTIIDHKKFTPFHYAAAQGNVELLSILAKEYKYWGLSLEAILSTTDDKGRTPIQVAADKGKWDAVIKIAQLHRTSSTDHEHYKQALLQAAKHNKYEVVRTLVHAGTDGDSMITWAKVKEIGANYRRSLKSFFSSNHPHHPMLAESMSNGTFETILRELGVTDPKEALKIAYQVLDNETSSLSQAIKKAFTQASLDLADLTLVRSHRIPYEEEYHNFKEYLQANVAAYRSTNIQTSNSSSSQNAASQVPSVTNATAHANVSLPNLVLISTNEADFGVASSMSPNFNTSALTAQNIAQQNSAATNDTNHRDVSPSKVFLVSTDETNFGVASSTTFSANMPVVSIAQSSNTPLNTTDQASNLTNGTEPVHTPNSKNVLLALEDEAPTDNLPQIAAPFASVLRQADLRTNLLLQESESEEALTDRAVL